MSGLDTGVGVRHIIKELAMKTRVGREIHNLYQHSLVHCYVMSYPKSGRTWLRVMLAKALALHFKDPRDTVYEPLDVIRACKQKGPRVRFLHGYRNHIAYAPTLEVEQSERRYTWYRHKKIVLLVRDPRDVMVSYYFHRTRRINETHTLSDFVRHPWWGVDRMIAFVAGWYEHRHTPADFLLVRYEDMHSRSTSELHRVLTFLGLYLSDEEVRTSVDYASFGNMRRMSTSELGQLARLAPSDPQDPESYKIRRGKVKGYADYLSFGDLEYIDARIRQRLPSALGYTAPT